MSKQNFVVFSKPGKPIQVQKTFLKEKGSSHLEEIQKVALEFDKNNLLVTDDTHIKIKRK